MTEQDFEGVDAKEMRRRWDAHTRKLETFRRSQLHKWCVIVGFACFALGILAGMGIVWVNDNWTPLDPAAETVDPDPPLLTD
jgi:hypothetical protein